MTELLETSDDLFDAGTTAQLTFDHLQILTFGDGGVGKNYFAETFPKPIVINMEDGLIGAKVRNKDIPYITPKKWAAIQRLFSDPKGVINVYHPGYEFETLVFDSISFLTSNTGICMQHIMAQKDSSKAPYPTITEFGRVTDKTRGLFALIRDLKYHVVLIMQTFTEKDDLTGEIWTKPKTMGQMRNECINWVDVAMWQTIEYNPKGEKEYVAYPTRVTRNLAKDRLGVLPDRIVNPSFQVIWNHIQQAIGG